MHESAVNTESTRETPMTSDSNMIAEYRHKLPENVINASTMIFVAFLAEVEEKRRHQPSSFRVVRNMCVRANEWNMCVRANERNRNVTARKLRGRQGGLAYLCRF